MRVLAVHADVIVVVSGFWQTTCTAVRSGDEGFVIDSPVLPDELDALPGLLAQAHFPISGLLCTHADWDHLLGRLAFADASLGTGESSAARLQAELGQAQRELREFDDQHYVERARPLALAGVQPLPVPGRIALGAADHELELYAADGHTADGTAYWLPWLRVLVVGDYLSPVEIPMISPGGSITAYRATLERLAPLVAQAETVIPGHGGPLSRSQADRLLLEDVDYLSALPDRGASTPLPRGRITSEQKRIHAENVAALPPS
jgi:glyoxylase-like metal-dependent hydrolase (beta-lactamase superfamily II)